MIVGKTPAGRCEGIYLVGSDDYHATMHELSVTESILSTVLKTAEEHQVTKILRIYLEVGELNDLKAEWIQHFFDYLSKDTIAADAIIEVRIRPTEFTCDDCGDRFPLVLQTVEKVSCPSCGGGSCSLSSGSGFYISDMEAV